MTCNIFAILLRQFKVTQFTDLPPCQVTKMSVVVILIHPSKLNFSPP